MVFVLLDRDFQADIFYSYATFMMTWGTSAPSVLLSTVSLRRHGTLLSSLC